MLCIKWCAKILQRRSSRDYNKDNKVLFIVMHPDYTKVILGTGKWARDSGKAKHMIV